MHQGLALEGERLLPNLLPQLQRLTIADTSLTRVLPEWNPTAVHAWQDAAGLAEAPAGSDPIPLLYEVNISGNPQLSGPLPSSWTKLTGLHGLSLKNNDFTGTLPANWTSMSFWLRSMDLSSNRLYGPVGAEWGHVASTIAIMSVTLRVVTLRGNQGMQGCIPSIWEEQYQVVDLDITGTGLHVCQGNGKPLQNFFNAPVPGWSPQNCDVHGYKLMSRQLPRELPREYVARVQLYAIHTGFNGLILSDPAPLPTLIATAMACDADPACVMFTSDGFLIGAYRVPSKDSELQAVAKVEEQHGWIAWHRMAYCSGRCCGTYMVDGLDLSFQQASPDPEQPVMEYSVPSFLEPLKFMYPSASCSAILPSTALSAYNDVLGYNVSDVVIRNLQLFNCPQRCKVGCCAFVSIAMQKNDTMLSIPWDGLQLSIPWDGPQVQFDQCNSAQCEGCDFPYFEAQSSRVQESLQVVYRLCVKHKGPCSSLTTHKINLKPPKANCVLC